jgi:hypothetical protein
VELASFTPFLRMPRERVQPHDRHELHRPDQQLVNTIRLSVGRALVEGLRFGGTASFRVLVARISVGRALCPSSHPRASRVPSQELLQEEASRSGAPCRDEGTHSQGP